MTNGKHTIVACAAVLALSACAAFAQGPLNRAGLWVGNATLNAVSDANPTISDLSFDLAMDGLLITEKMISLGSSWRYSDTGANLGLSWRNTGFDDSGWKTGTAEFGYGDGDEATTNSYGTVATNKTITTYFRKTFSVLHPEDYSSLTFRLRRDDGAVVYLNGSQVMRANMPTVYSYDTLALSTVDGTNESALVEAVVPANLLLSNNVVAVEIHQASRSSDDTSFDLEVLAEATTSPQTTLFPIHSSWSYLVPQSNMPSAWKDLGFDDAGWDAGNGEFGYGNGGETTLIGYGDATNKNKATYFRKTFVVPSPSAFSHLDIWLMRDDGAAVYINGREVLRSNLSETDEVAYDTAPLLPITSSNEYQYTLTRVPATDLVAGTNVVAVSIHQYAGELGEMSVGAPTPTPATFDMRLLVHVASNGQVRLLKEVIQMWKNGTYATAPDGTNQVVSVPGRFVLITDDTLLSNFQGVGVRDGQGIGRRMSSVGIDFDGTSLDMAGTFGVGSSVVVSNTLASDFRTNPFKHTYHPDHDNLNARYDGSQKEAPDVSRRISLTLSSRYPADTSLAEETAPPGWGMDRVGGLYEEVLTGLHKNPILVSGYFELQRVSAVGSLNDE